jgi:hypothetical protein
MKALKLRTRYPVRRRRQVKLAVSLCLRPASTYCCNVWIEWQKLRLIARRAGPSL